MNSEKKTEPFKKAGCNKLKVNTDVSEGGRRKVKKWIIRLVAVWFMLCMPQMLGFRGPVSGAVLNKSKRWDPDGITPLRAFTKDEQILMEYAVSNPTEIFQLKLYDIYWASITLDVINDVQDGKWRIYRNPKPPADDLKHWHALKIYQLSDFQHPPAASFINKDSLLTYIIDKNNLERPVVILDKSAPAGFNFHLIGDRKLHDSYRGHWNLPRDQFIYMPAFWAHAWKLPFACILDYPATAFVFLFSPRW